MSYAPGRHPRDTPNTSGKGLEGQNCNVTACQLPDSAHHYNKWTHAYYCIDCATDINEYPLNGTNSYAFENDTVPKGISK